MIRRPNWDEYWMLFAVLAAMRSTCVHYKVGAVLAREKQILTIGFNGPVSGDSHCAEVGCAKMKDGVKLPSGSGMCRGAHAEINAIANAANLGVSIGGASFYITHRPCYPCAKQIVNAGIKRIVYLDDYDGEPQAIDLLRKASVQLVPFKVLSDLKFNGVDLIERR